MSVFIFRAFFVLQGLILLLSVLRPVALWQPVLLLLPFVAVAYWHQRRCVWQGAALILLSWCVFPLLKGIRQHWLMWQADGLLSDIDRFLWAGKILPAYFHYESQPVWADVLALCYFLFYAIVLWSLYFFTRHGVWRERFFDGLLGVYLCGFCGYFLLPAAGPAFTSLPDMGATGAVAKWAIELVKGGVTGMDVFPSLHTAVSLFINGFLWRSAYRRLALALAPITLGIVAATIFLRYHYGIDVLVGIVLALYWLRFSFRRLNDEEVA